MTDAERFRRAIEAIDAANAADPHEIRLHGATRPKELAHSELATVWLRRLLASPSEALLLAVRAHHLRRWAVPRASYPAGRPGYLRWRRDAQQRHAEEVGALLAGAGYGTDVVARVQAIVRKQGLGTDPEVQAFEDALCLVFLETQLEAFAAAQPGEKAGAVLRKTLRKMSLAARARLPELELRDELRASVVRIAEELG
jgi:Domain of unknown function (DUF4202)